MRQRFFLLPVLGFVWICCPAQKAQPVHPFASCNNFDFESGYAGWGGGAWNFVTSTTFVVTPTAPYHKLAGAGFDNIIAPLSTLAPSGGTQSALIGLPNPGSQEYWIQQTFVVSAANPVYVYQHAVVFKDLDQFSPPHTAAQQNYFEVMFTDQNGDTIPCGYSKVLVSQATPANGYQAYIYTDPNQSPPNNQIPHLWHDWSSTPVDLTAYIGTNVTVRFKAHSCALGDHYTYAYIDGHCEPATSNNTSLTICQGSTATLNGPAGFTGYSWLPAGQTTQNISVSTAGGYTVTATGQAGCIRVETYSVTVDPAPAVFANPTNVNICSGNSTTLTASATPSAGVTFSWSPSTGLSSTTGATVVASPTSAVTYTVIGTNANGCTSFSTVQVAVGQIPVANVQSQTICTGQIATLTATGGGTYLWNTGQTSASVTATASANYSVIVTNPAGCSDTAFASVTVSPGLTALVSSATICAGQTATLNASGGSNYSWNTGQSSSSITTTSPGTYSVIVSNSNGCMDTATASVSVQPLPSVSVSATTICIGQSATLSAGGSGNYLWNTGSTASMIIVSPTSATTYSVTATNSCGTSSSSANVTVNPLPAANAGADVTICIGGSTILNASGSGNYLWSTGSSASSITVSPSVTTGYTVTASNSCGNVSDVVTVTIGNTSVASISGTTVLCVGQSAVLSASGGTVFLWSNGSTSNSIAVSPSATTIYSVIVTSGTCTDTAVVTVSVSPPPVAVTGNAVICQGQMAVLSASGGGTYLWNTGATTNSINVSAAGSYSVTVSANGCSDTASATVVVNPSPVAGATGNVLITQGQSTTLTASGGGTYVWSNEATTQSISVEPAVTTQYCVVVTNANGCTDSTCITVVVEPTDCSKTILGRLYLPNAFSPNGDSENETLKIYFGDVQCIKTFSLNIFNRWGEKVYESTNPAKEWDGTNRGKPENSGVFAFFMRATLYNGEEIINSGNINLIK